MDNPLKEQHKDLMNPTLKRKRNRSYSLRVAALFILPAAFALLTAFLLYTSLEPPVGHYARMVMTLVGTESFAISESRNLLEHTPPPEPDIAPVEWVGIEDQLSLIQKDEEDSEEEEPEESIYIKRSEIDMPNPGDLYGRITISGTDVDSPVFWGDSERELNKGVGTYMGWLPGFGRTIILAGHRNTDFKDLGSVETGAIITVATHYETYTYEVIRTAVHHMDDTSSYDLLREDENIILYTCYPFDFIGAARERFFVYGEPLTGKPIARYS